MHSDELYANKENWKLIDFNWRPPSKSGLAPETTERESHAMQSFKLLNSFWN